jgi:class 3 adenylate cyclase
MSTSVHDPHTEPPGRATMDVGDWLRSLGLGQYEAAFRENEIDGKVLPKLTVNDLTELGVVLIGHRRTILSAIGLISAPLTPAAPIAEGVSTSTSAPGKDTAERRQLTVMFCDLVGSTALAAQLDPEDMRGIIGAYHRCCASLIQGGGGFVAKYMGDGVLAYFGYPRAHEHDAGLAIVEAAPKLQTPAGAPLHVRVGIATGIVVVGDLLGSGEAQERGVVGGTPNLAARLQAIAEPGAVVIAEGTRKLLGDLFELNDLGQRPQGHCRTDARLGGGKAKRAGEPLRGAARYRTDGPRRARGRKRSSAATLGKGKGGRG